MTNFLIDKFIPIEMKHKTEIEKITKKYPARNSLYTFASLAIWGSVYNFSFYKYNEDLIFVQTTLENEKNRQLLKPIGDFTPQAAEFLLDEIKKLNYPIKIFSASDDFINKHSDFCSHFQITNERNYANYLYRTMDLAQLEGRRYSSKRNLIYQAERLYTWTTIPLTPENLASSTHFVDTKELRKGTVSGFDREIKALHYMLEHYAELEQRGVVILVDDKPVAFSIYEELNPTTALVRFEKVVSGMKGLSQIINKETAMAIQKEGYEFINREEDLGLEGLRKTKMSYHPIELVPSYMLTFRGKISM